MSSKNNFKLLKAIETNRAEIIKLIEAHDNKRTRRTQIDLAAFFKQLENIVQNRDVHEFHHWLKDWDNIPFEYGNLQSLTIERFDLLLQTWSTQRQPQIRSVASSEVFTEDEEQIIVQTQELIRKRNDAIKEYMNSLPDKTRLGDFNVNQLLKEILGDHLLYEYNADFEHFFDKVGSYVALLQIVKGYRESQRKIVPSDDEKYIYLKEMPYLLAYWHKINPQLCIQPSRRKRHKETQTDLPYMKSSGPKDISLQTILNLTIDQLKSKKNQTDNNQWLESIDYLIITLRKERNRLYPQYRPKNMKLFTEPSILEMSKMDKKQVQRIRGQLLKEIFDNYLEKDEDNPKDEIQTKKIYGFLQDIGVGHNQITQKRTLSIIDARLKDRTSMTFSQFQSLINELVPLQQSKLSQGNLQSFINELRAAKFFQKTIKVSKRYEKQKMVSIVASHRASRQYHRQHLGIKTPSISKSPVQQLHSRGNSLLIGNKRKKTNQVLLQEIYTTAPASPHRNLITHSIELQNESQRKNVLPSRSIVIEHDQRRKRHRYKMVNRRV